MTQSVRDASRDEEMMSCFLGVVGCESLAATERGSEMRTLLVHLPFRFPDAAHCCR